MKGKKVQTIQVKHFLTYTANGCDCCEPTDWDNYQVDGDERSFSDLEDLYLHVLENKLGVNVEVEYE